VKPILLLLAANGLAFGQTANCAVDGLVMNSITGEPIPRAHVTLGAGMASSSATADSSGKWNFSNVACSEAVLTSERPGFVQKPGRRLTLLSGFPLHDVKIEMTPQSVFVGRVLDDQGDPVMGAEVRVLASRVVEGQVDFRQTQDGITNDLGDYRIAGLPRGNYIVCSSLTSARTVAETCYPGPVEGGAASATEVRAGRETRVDFTLNPTPVIHIRGTVSGAPAGYGVGVSLIKRSAKAGPYGMHGRVDRNGFDIWAAPGSYTLAADYFEAGKHLFARVPIEAGRSDIDNVVLTLNGGFTITGTVEFPSQPEEAGARPQFDIQLLPSAPFNLMGLAKWNKDHTAFTFEDVAPGDYRLDTLPPAPFYVKSATLAGQDILDGEFALSQAAGPIEIVLSDDGGSIEGDVADADGQPATCVVLALRNGRAVTAEATGHFKLQNLGPGDYAVYAWDDPARVAYADTDWMRRYAGSGVAVTVTAGQNSQVKLTQQKVPE
jgi:hypothetical protein